MDKKNEVIKHADRVLKNYPKFRKLAKISNKPFSNHGLLLLNEIDEIINKLPELEKAIIKNRYQTSGRKKKTVKAFCYWADITLEEYQEEYKKGMMTFSREYQQGVLFTLLEGHEK